MSRVFFAVTHFFLYIYNLFSIRENNDSDKNKERDEGGMKMELGQFFFHFFFTQTRYFINSGSTENSLVRSVARGNICTMERKGYKGLPWAGLSQDVNTRAVLKFQRGSSKAPPGDVDKLESVIFAEELIIAQDVNLFIFALLI